MKEKKLPLIGWVGIGIIAAAELLLFLRIQPIPTFFTPIVWTGYIFFVDSIVFKRSGNSLMQTYTKEFLFMLPISIALWLIFEFYNLFPLQNWHYSGLPENILVRRLSYAWAFATIWPGVLETYELIETTGFFKFKVKPWNVSRKLCLKLTITGLLFLLVPFFVSQRIGAYLAGLVWIGFIFLLDPINYKLGLPSILEDLSKGNASKFIKLCIAGFICGILWEFWNYWAVAKWQYTIPILGSVKIFEMPILGYLGFLTFGVEVWVMYISSDALIRTIRKAYA